MDVPPSVRELILSHHLSGHSCRQIATMVHVSKSTVIRLVKRYKDTGSIEAIRIGNCGRHLLLSQRDERALARQSVADPSRTAREIQSSVRGNTTRASISTIKRALRRQGRLAFRPRKSPSLNIAQRQVRLRWCQEHRNWTKEQWTRTIFSDETYVDVSGSQAPFVRRSRDEPVRICHTTQHRPFLQRIMFWGAITGVGPITLVPVSGTMTARKYVKVLEDHLVPFMDNQPLAFRYVFQHDNAPCHRAKETTLFLKENCIDVLHKWPPYSPDLNVIENLWAYIKMKVRRENIASKENLRVRVLEIWQSQELKELCGRLVASMKKRIILCIKNKGGYIKY